MTYTDDTHDRPTDSGAPLPDPAKVLDDGARQTAAAADNTAANAASDAASDAANAAQNATAQGAAAQGAAAQNAAAQGAATPADRHGRTFTEEFRLSGEAVVAKVKELVREGNVRRIAIKNDDGKVLIEIPLTIGVIGTVLLPVWAAVGAIAAMVANLTITVERSA